MTYIALFLLAEQVPDIKPRFFGWRLRFRQGHWRPWRLPIQA